MTTIIETEGNVIEDKAFANDEELINVIIPEGITHIGDFVFRGCEKLTSIVMSEATFNLIGDNVFEGCVKLNIK